MNWDAVWGTVLGGFVVAFGVFETLGYRAKKHGKLSGTLTATIRRWGGVDPKKPRRWVFSGLFGAFWLWFVVHILTPYL